MVRYVGGQPRSVITIETDGERVTAFRNVLNPDKLARLEPLPG